MQSKCLALVVCTLLFPVVVIAQEFACLKTETASSPVVLSDSGETALDTAKTKKAAAKKLKSLKRKISVEKKKSKRLKKSKRGLKAKQKKKVNKRIAKSRTKIRRLKSQQQEQKNILQFLKDCKDGNVSSLFPQILDVQKFTVAANEVFDTGSDLTVRSAETIEIGGALVGESGSGAEVKLIAESGDINIASGAMITAGNGSTGSNTVQTIEYFIEDDNFTTSLATLRVVDAEPGVAGGDISLIAESGSVSVGTGVALHLGNGGDGASISLKSTNDVPSNGEEEVELENSGGDSGILRIKTNSVSGLNGTLNADGFFELDGSEPKLSGGIGGKGGSTTIGQSGEASILASSLAFSRRGRLRAKIIPPRLVKGAKGGSGIFSGGDGGPIEVTGRNGKAGQGGQSVGATGGNGGNCQTSASIFGFRPASPGCTGGDGGTATATGGKGGNQNKAGKNGGDGGSSKAVGGTPGTSAIGGGTPVCGDSIAVGGLAGKGGGKCPRQVSDAGGSGGQGGRATADSTMACAAAQHGFATAVSGNGGNGGDGKSSAGAGGIAGLAEALGMSGSIERVGTRGSDGARCNGGEVVIERVLTADEPCAMFAGTSKTIAFKIEVPANARIRTIGAFGVDGGPRPSRLCRFSSREIKSTEIETSNGKQFAVFNLYNEISVDSPEEIFPSILMEVVYSSN